MCRIQPEHVVILVGGWEDAGAKEKLCLGKHEV